MRENATFLNVLLIEDNAADVFLLKRMLTETSLAIGNIFEADKIGSAYRFLAEQKIDVILLDLSLPDSTGLDSLLQVHELAGQIPVIILTGLRNADLAMDAVKCGAQDYLVKGDYDHNLLQKAIQYGIERKKQEEELRVSEEKYRQIFQNSPFPSWIYNSETLQIIEVNEAAIFKYGYSYDEFTRLNLRDIRPPEDIPEFLASIGDLASEGRVWRHTKKNGEIILVEVTFYPVSYFGEKAIQAQINDVTENKRLEEKLKWEQQLRQRQITKAIVIAGERERKYIGAELHDNINQLLTTVKLYLDLCMSGHEKRDEMIEKSSRNVRAAIDEIRKLSRKLVSPDKDSGSLAVSLAELVQDITLASGIQLNLDITKLREDLLEEDLKITAYRIVQEQISNILRHAKATTVSVQLSVEGNKLVILTTDNGSGFDLNAARQGVGLTNMISRVEMLSGEIKIITSPGAGCRIETKFPLHVGELK